MVVTAAAKAAVIVPDVATWLMNGHDPLAAGFTRVVAPERARAVVLPERVPQALVEAVDKVMQRIPGEPDRIVLGDLIPEAETRSSNLSDGRAEHGGHSGHGGHDAHDEHGGHEHHDMMAITGDPSADGLIMEPIDFSLGPLAPSLPGGLVIELSLDGDVVASARPTATLPLSGDASTPDPLTPLTWRVAAARARAYPSEAEARQQITALEVERALSHALSVHAVGFALGWRELADASLALARALLPARAAGGLEHRLATEDSRGLRSSLAEAQRPLASVGRLVAGRAARRRLRGRAVVDATAAGERKVGGPIARAAGLDVDERVADGLYESLGFELQGASDGDALARVVVRVAEIRASLALAEAAAAERGSDEASPGGPAGLPVAVEGPRGAVHAVAAPDDGVAIAMPGAEPARELAGEAIVGLELAAATAALASFDLSPWRAAP